MKRLLNWLLGRPDRSRERRRSPRYPAFSNRAFLLWREGGQTRFSKTRLLNLSGVGTLVVTDRQPAKGLAVWLRVEEPTPTEWVEATVVRQAGSHKVGLNFVRSW